MREGGREGEPHPKTEHLFQSIALFLSEYESSMIFV